MSLRALGILGGTFDPVHTGHVQSALELCQRLKLDRVDLMPCHLPPHRESPQCTADDRLAMVTLAVADQSELGVDDRELRRHGPSYTADTLAEVRAELGENTSLNFIMGSDAYNALHRWVRWQSLFEFANVLVMKRQGYDLKPAAEVTDFVAPRELPPEQLAERAQGAFAALELQPWPQSATAIRQRLSAGEALGDWVPATVARYIATHHLFTENTGKQ